MADLKRIQKQSEGNLGELANVEFHHLRQLLDIDGVFSAPHRNTSHAEADVVRRLAETVRNSAEVSLATGRPGIWITKPNGILGLLRGYLNKEEDQAAAARLVDFSHFAENGAVIVRSKDAGYSEQVVADRYRFPGKFLIEAERIIKHLGIQEFAAVDRDKSCVLSIYVYRDGFGEQDLAPHKDAIVADFRAFAGQHLSDWIVGATAIAVDAHHRDVSKVLASKGYVDSLKESDRSDSDLHFVAVGDSTSDFALYQGLREAQLEGKLDKNAKLFFVFTGKEADLERLHEISQRDLSRANDFIYAGVIGTKHEVRLYSDATLAFFDRLLEGKQ